MSDQIDPQYREHIPSNDTITVRMYRKDYEHWKEWVSRRLGNRIGNMKYMDNTVAHGNQQKYPHTQHIFDMKYYSYISDTNTVTHGNISVDDIIQPYMCESGDPWFYCQWISGGWYDDRMITLRVSRLM